MKRIVSGRWILSLVVSCILGGGMLATAQALDRRRIVVFAGLLPVETQLQVADLSGVKVLHILSLVNALAIELPPLLPEVTLALLQANPLVLRVEEDPLVGVQGAGSDGAGSDGVFVTPTTAPTTEFYPWGIDWIGAAEIQEDNPGLAGDGVKVALLDTGVDATHLDLRQNILGGYNAIAEADPRNWRDDNGHGTHVAGIMAGERNRRGVIGVVPRVRLYVFKVLDRYGKGRTSDVINALQRVPTDIRIIAGSFGTDLVWPSFEEAISRLQRSGKLMVFSAGNRCTPNDAQGAGSDGAGSDASCTSTASDIKFPARYPGVIAVGASDGNDQVPAFSRSGTAMADHGVVAPGVHIFSTNLGGGYGVMHGTSAAAPHVAGAVALALQLRPQLSYEELWSLLQQTAQDTGDPADVQGVGRLRVEELVRTLRSTYGTTTLVSESLNPLLNLLK